ncbi:hypothetical protein J6590_032795 [Homalodisca vitripennis]|nr:hypothetical protein J6590_032795 [Homalodisca vitripennis]
MRISTVKLLLNDLKFEKSRKKCDPERCAGNSGCVHGSASPSAGVVVGVSNTVFKPVYELGIDQDPGTTGATSPVARNRPRAGK